MKITIYNSKDDKISISPYDDGYWLSKIDGEGMWISADALYDILSKYYDENL